MLYHHERAESELMEMARDALRRRRETAGVFVTSASSAPDTVPCSEFQAFLAGRAARRARSLQRCHHYSQHEKPRHAPPPDTGAFVPATAARLDDDRNLTDGARRCARKIMELAYRTNRAGRTLDTTTTYLGKALHRCRRTVQRHLRELEREGYISVDIVAGHRSRLCTGLIVTLLAPLFPRHHRRSWPEKPGNPGATAVSQNQRKRFIHANKRHVFSVEAWTARCMDGVFRALMKTIAPLPPIDWLGEGERTA